MKGTFSRSSSHRHEFGCRSIPLGVEFQHQPAQSPGPPRESQTPHRLGRPPSRPATQWQTTGVLTAAMIVYALGAGITAAAGTRLALQLILITVFGLHPFQVPPTNELAGLLRIVAASQKCFCIGQFARLLPTLVVVAVSQAPSPESNPNSPLPVIATVVHYTTVQADRSEVRVIKRLCGRSHHSASATDPKGSSLSQQTASCPWGRWSSCRLGAIHHHVISEGSPTNHMCCGRPLQACISHKVLEDVQLGTWQVVPTTRYHIDDC